MYIHTYIYICPDTDPVNNKTSLKAAVPSFWQAMIEDNHLTLLTHFFNSDSSDSFF